LLIGDFAPKTWQKLSLLIILQFQGMLWLAWFLRSPHVAASTPFQNVISTLGQGRMDGNIGAWIFDCAFCTFALLLIPWNLHLARRVSHVSRLAGKVLMVIGFISLFGVACVAIFDEQPMGPVSRGVSQFMYGFGAATAFGGHTVGAIISWCVFASVYARTPRDAREVLHHPGKLLIAVFALLPPMVLLVVSPLPGHGDSWATGPLPEFMGLLPFWQWTLMLSLMFWLYAMARWYPDSFSGRPEGAPVSL